MTNLTRRTFLGGTLGAAAASTLPVWGTTGRPAPSEVFRVAVCGVKGRGMSHVGEFVKMKDVQVVAIVDVDETVVESAMKMVEKASGKRPEYYKDYRKMLEDKSIDGVSVATCNHTHTLLGISAVIAGKHAYVEKPLSHNVWEGRRLVEAARKYKKCVQHGTQSRSAAGHRKAAAFLAAGKMGKIAISRGLCYKRRGSIGKQGEGAPPAGVDYDIWLGPAQVKPFTKNRFHYNWHWMWDTGNGDIGNQGVHEMDKARWYLGKDGLPNKVMCVGGRFGYEDDGETPNTQIVVFDYGDSVLTFEVRGLETEKYMGEGIGNLVHAEKGHVAGTSAFDKEGKKIEIDVKDDGRAGNHFRNFIEAAMANKPEMLNADVLDGHLSSALCHLANISYRVGEVKPMSTKDPFGAYDDGNQALDRMKSHLKDNGVDLEKTQLRVGRVVTFDPKTETIVGDPEASKLLTREYRKPFVVPESP
jgi:predicted dehydrogenase